MINILASTPGQLLATNARQKPYPTPLHSSHIESDTNMVLSIPPITDPCNCGLCTCRRVAGSVNAEFLHIDKFLSQLGGCTVIVTDSWIIQCNMHSVNIIHQRDAVLKCVCVCVRVSMCVCVCLQ